MERAIMALLSKKRKYAASDFNYQNLPQTRKEQFFDLLKHRYNLLVKIGLTLLLFAIPLVFTIFCDQYFQVGFNQMLKTGEISEEDYANTMFLLTIILKAVYIVDFMVFSIGVAGISRVLRQLIYSEPVYFWHDFKLGVKSNIKQFLFNSFILGLINFICSIIYIFYGVLSLFGVLVTLLTILIALPFFVANLAYTPVYDSKIGISFKNTFLVCLSMKFKILLCTFIMMFPSLILMVPIAGLSTIIFSVILVFLYPIILLGFNLYMYNVFDSIINTAYYKEIVRKGLYNGDTSSL